MRKFKENAKKGKEKEKEKEKDEERGRRNEMIYLLFSTISRWLYSVDQQEEEREPKHASDRNDQSTSNFTTSHQKEKRSRQKRREKRKKEKEKDKKKEKRERKKERGQTRLVSLFKMTCRLIFVWLLIRSKTREEIFR